MEKKKDLNLTDRLVKKAEKWLQGERYNIENAYYLPYLLSKFVQFILTEGQMRDIMEAEAELQSLREEMQREINAYRKIAIYFACKDNNSKGFPRTKLVDELAEKILEGELII